jgi:hypothetical protein
MEYVRYLILNHYNKNFGKPARLFDTKDSDKRSNKNCSKRDDRRFDFSLYRTRTTEFSFRSKLLYILFVRCMWVRWNLYPRLQATQLALIRQN